MIAPATPIATAAVSDVAASAISVRSLSRVRSGRPLSSSSAWAATPTASRNAARVATSRPACSVGAAAAPIAT
ncbi:MAG TPA: hypothetical protein VHX62_18745 [Solirubrobacteraceae bacterium]|nr:hypothetical protein [Solirubrobacteraceae bacterium]